ncbi:hypothetical protein [Pleurocapsa sp. PCC 7319]|uniref:hypothetical protein n=1 Tax=Pleurocapsa sp. PCC 7319 TaxID=118161 RepID=UPI0003487385|nr:hypothetical protein [Pleurocapsa sp. PCC 7319]
MKKVLFGSFTSLLVLLAAPGIATEVTPSNLVFQGYQGRLASEGIPGYATFLQAVHLGKIDATTLVDGAISQGKLEPKTAQNESYLRQVKSSLFLLRVGGGSR